MTVNLVVQSVSCSPCNWSLHQLCACWPTNMGFQARAPHILMPPGTRMTKWPGSQRPTGAAASGWTPAEATMARLCHHSDFRLFDLLPDEVTNRFRTELWAKHSLQGENKGLVEPLIHSLKMATSKDNNLLWMRPQPGGNTQQCFLQRSAYLKKKKKVPTNF